MPEDVNFQLLYAQDEDFRRFCETVVVMSLQMNADALKFMYAAYQSGAGPEQIARMVAMFGKFGPPTPPPNGY